MSVVVDKLSGSKVKLTITVSSELFEKGLDYAFDRVKKNVKIDGFRNGKIPRGMFEKKFGIESLYEEAVNFCITETYGEALDNEGIDVVAMPKIDLSFDKVSREKGFKYTAEVAVKPVAELGKYTKLGLAQEAMTVTEGEIEAEIARLLASKVVIMEKQSDVLENGDIAMIDFEGFVNDEAFEGGKGEAFELTIGSGQFIPGFEDQMVGMKKGETKDVHVTFPTVYHAENLAGKEAKFVVTLHDIKERKVPALTEEIIAELNIANVTTEAELKKDIETKLTDKKNQIAEDTFVEAIMKQIVETSTIDVAEEHIEAEANKLMDNVKSQAKQYNMELEMFAALALGGKSVEQLKEELEKQAEKKIKYAAVLDAVATAEKFEVEKADLNEKYEEFAKAYGMAVEQIENMIPADILSNDIKFEKAIKFLMANAK